MTHEAVAIAVEKAEGAPDIRKLEESFRVFNQMTRSLETAYSKLTKRVAKIDVELSESNAELQSKVDELEAATRSRNEILDALPSGVVVIDAHGSVMSVNPAAERILGRRAAEIVDRSRDTMIGPEGDHLLVASGAVERKKEGQIEKDLVTLDGSRRRIGITVVPLKEGGEIQVLSDLTVVTRLREQLGRLDTLAALGEMAAGVAHEIRNPLNGVDGFAALLGRTLKTKDVGPEAARYVDNIRRGVREVNSIIANLLTFAAPERLTATPIKIAPIVDEIVGETVREHDGGDWCRVVADMGPLAADATILGDPLKLKIALRNLVKNACEAAGPKGKVDVRLEVDRATRRATVRVEDDGPGLPTEIRDRLFRPFTTTKAEGTGLGLAIAHKLITLHGGDLRHEDREKGTTFAVSLPILAEEAELR